MRFSDVFGQKHIIKYLKKSISNNSVSHAYVFEGPDGIGKRTVAKVFGKALVCESTDSEPCRECRSCLLFQSNSHPDIKTISSNSSIGVDTIRDIVKDVNTKPYYGVRKIYIIENADKMTIQAQNSLLKTLEEPPNYAVIILTTSNIELLLSTLLSRCIIKKFVRNTNEEVYQYIKANYPNSFDEKVIISLADGIIGNVKKIISSNDMNRLRQETYNVIKTMVKGKEYEALETVAFFSQQKDNIDLILHIMLLFFRDILISSQANDNSFLVNTDYLDSIYNLGEFIKPDGIRKCIDAILEAKNNLLSNSNFSLTIEVLVLKINNFQGAMA